MIFEIVLGLVFITAISFQVIHWCIYFYSRYSKNLQPYRNLLQLMIRTTEKLEKHNKAKEKIFNNDDNKGYS